MLFYLKKNIPEPIKRVLAPINDQLVNQWRKYRLYHQMQKKHKLMLTQLKCKKRIRVVFLAIHRSVWKVDPVFQKMLADKFFEPMILVCPYQSFGDERMREELSACIEFFKCKNYPTISSYLPTEKRWIRLEELSPDIVFFTNPHNITQQQYYEFAYTNYLSCYVPYHHEVGSFGNNNSQHNQLFHNAIWKIFSAHNDSYEIARKISANRGRNVIITGFPAMENLINLKATKTFKDVWKHNDSRARIIWAPHHLINEKVNQSNFLRYAMLIKQLAEQYVDKVSWAFKPHPILKAKLLEHPDWGAERTNEYYKFWQNQEFSQLELGSYEDLFLSSTAMIHDCGSFLAEYMYTEKPVMYLLNDAHTGQFFNHFGKSALSSCRIGRSERDLIDFVDGVAHGEISEITKNHQDFLNLKINPFFNDAAPSDLIIDTIRTSIKNAR